MLPRPRGASEGRADSQSSLLASTDASGCSQMCCHRSLMPFPGNSHWRVPSHSSVCRRCLTLTNSISVICDVDSHFASLGPKGSPRDLSVSPRGKPLHQRPESRKSAQITSEAGWPPDPARASWTSSPALDLKLSLWTGHELWVRGRSRGRMGYIWNGRLWRIPTRLIPALPI